jgi:hypothetical protein
MRLGTESIGRWGLVILVITGVLGGVLATHGWSARSTGLPRVTLGNNRSAPATPTTPPGSQGPTAPAQSPSADHKRPLLSAQPYANVSYQIWPGTPSAAAKTALIGLTVSVKQQGSALVITAGVNGQTPPAPRRYEGGVRVYVVEASLGDDSGNTDYNLGDDALIVTDAKGGIIQ